VSDELTITDFVIDDEDSVCHSFSVEAPRHLSYSTAQGFCKSPDAENSV